MKRFEKVSAVSLGLLGALLASLPPSSTLARLSYELPFLLKHEIREEIVIIYEDDRSRSLLDAASGQPLQRTYYAELLKNLSLARIVVFDFVFSQPRDPESDRRLEEALRLPPPVVLAANLLDQVQEGTHVRRIEWPYEPFRNASTVGLIQLEQTPSGVHRVHESDLLESLSWQTARLLGAEITLDPEKRHQPRWLNYYGPSGGMGPLGPIPGTLPSMSLADALVTTNTYFENKIVFVGSNVQLSSSDAQKDAFDTPYSARSGGYNLSPGVDLHATAALNLIHNEWLNYANKVGQVLFCLFFGIGLYKLLIRITPVKGLLVTVSLALAIAAISCALQLVAQVWWVWMVPVAAQIPAGFVLTTGQHYTLELTRRRRYRKAFAAYLSPYMADKVMEQETQLSLGGDLAETTILFTDLEGFTTLSEQLQPQEVAEILTTYFNRTTNHILDNRGTITKYIGDAVMAIWGAPLSDNRQADRAVQAAIGMIRAGTEPIAGRRLNTRIGIHSGQVLVGNLGSDFRFDYTAIGDNVNMAARLEGLNKNFGSQILISRATLQRMTESVPMRYMGRFVVVGKSEPIEIFQVFSGEGYWTQDRLEIWHRALEHFASRDFSTARSLFQDIACTDNPPDKSVEFYLKEMAKLETDTLHPDWHGEIRLSSK